MSFSFLNTLDQNITDAKQQGDEEEFVAIATNLRAVISAAQDEIKRRSEQQPLTGSHLSRVLEYEKLGKHLLATWEHWDLGLTSHLTDAVHVLTTASDRLLSEFLNAPAQSRTWDSEKTIA
jgi:hypothetical protein